MASRDPYARVIYGGGDRRDEGWWDRDHERGDRGRAIPRRSPYPYPDGDRYPDRLPYPEGRYPDRYPGDRGGYAYGGVPFDNGYKDGYEKGRDDARENDAYEPRRHSRYRSADRGYDRRYGSKENYKDTYREGFRAGYDEGYRAAYGPDQRGGRVRLPWPY